MTTWMVAGIFIAGGLLGVFIMCLLSINKITTIDDDGRE